MKGLGVHGEDYIKEDFTYVGCEFVEWIYLAQDRVQWRVLVRNIISFIFE